MKNFDVTRPKRIIPCLDVRGGRVVKGVNFVNIKDVGDPVECAMEYERQGADELVFLDITATTEERQTMVDIVRQTAASISIPLAVGGGVRSVDDFRALFDAGAAKVSINSAAVKHPELISEAVDAFGSERVVLAIDATSVDGVYHVLIAGGSIDAGIGLPSWAHRGAELGASEILLTSLDADGTKGGFDIKMTKAVCDAVKVPVIASGGGGSLESFVDVFKQTDVDAALAASIFHFGELTVGDVKQELMSHGIPVR